MLLYAMLHYIVLCYVVMLCYVYNMPNVYKQPNTRQKNLTWNVTHSINVTSSEACVAFSQVISEWYPGQTTLSCSSGAPSHCH